MNKYPWISRLSSQISSIDSSNIEIFEKSLKHFFTETLVVNIDTAGLKGVKSFSRLASIVIEREGGGDEFRGREWSHKRRLPGSSRTYDNIGCSIGIHHLLVRERRARQAENVNE